MSLLTNLIGYWDFDENGGSVVGDSSSEGNNGTWKGTLGSQWTTGVINSGGHFNGSDNYVDLGTPSNLGLSGNQPFTISLWVNPTATSLGCSPFDYGIAANNERISLTYADTLGTLLSSHYGNDNTFTTKVDFGVKNHIVLTYDGTTESLYKNGAFEESWNPAALSISGGHLYIGHDITTLFVKATMIDEVGFWSRHVDATEVSQLYNNGNGLGYSFIVTTLQTQNGKARVTAISSQLQSGKARLQVTANQIELGKSRIQKSVLQTQQGKTNLVVNSIQTQSGKARVGVPVNQTQKGKAFILSAYGLYRIKSSADYHV